MLDGKPTSTTFYILMMMKLIWRVTTVLLCLFVVTRLMFLLEVVSYTSNIRMKRQLLRQFSTNNGSWSNSTADRRFLPDEPIQMMIKTLKASETVIASNVTDYPMGVAIGTLVRVYKENGSSDIQQRIGNKYRLIQKLGSGGFAIVFLGVDIWNGEQVAIKIERPERSHNALYREETIYKLLQDGEGYLTIKWKGREGQYNMMAIDLLGPSLDDLMHACSHKLSLKTVLLIADQLISRLEYMHSKHIINRDVKPHNFLIGMGRKSNIIYCIDFGLCRKYRHERTWKHIPYAANKSFAGTLRYATINTQLGIAQSRRDDMESLGYVLIHLLRGKLPWQFLKYKTKAEKYKKVLDKKRSTSLEDLCEGFPVEFLTYLRICRAMKFDEKPNYSYFRRLFTNAYKKQNYSLEKHFDWNIPSGRCEEKLKRKLSVPSSIREVKVWVHDPPRP